MILNRLKELERLIESSECSSSKVEITLEEAFLEFYWHIRKTQEKGVVYVIGNGGSAGIASHFHIDLLKRHGVPSSTFYDTNVMTALLNDIGVEAIFAHPLKVLGRPSDLLVAISSSGQSPNILRAVEVAKEKSMRVITLSGFKADNPLRKLGDVNFWLDKRDYGLVETGHFFLLHTLIDLWESLKIVKASESLRVSVKKQKISL